MLGPGGAATVGLALALFLRPGDRALAVDVWLLVVGALVLLNVIAWTIGSLPAERPTPLDRKAVRTPTDVRPAELAKLEREVELSTQTAFDAHYRLRPTVRQIAAVRLRARGVDLDSASGSAETLLGPLAWELARPDRPRPRRHEAPGIDLAEIEIFVTALEAL